MSWQVIASQKIILISYALAYFTPVYTFACLKPINKAGMVNSSEIPGKNQLWALQFYISKNECFLMNNIIA